MFSYVVDWDFLYLSKQPKGAIASYFPRLK